MDNMIGLEELKKIELQILKQIHEICEEHGFRYFLVGGTLLGAVRHRGFIPWDDDIDIAMPRPDYENFIDFCMSNDVPFRIACSKVDANYGRLFAKAMDKNTVLVETVGRKNSPEMGVSVDVFPIDGLADSYEKAKAHLNSTLFNRELLVAANWGKFLRSKTKSIIYEPFRFALFCLSRFCNFRKLINKIEKQYPKDSFDKCKYVACICGAYRNKEIVDREIFSEYVKLPFEGEQFRCPKAYDRYLSSIYGDYMQLPPVEKRVTHHDYKAWYK